MPANWGVFQANVANFLTNQQSGSVSETADFFATEYDNAMKTAGTILGNTVSGGVNKNALKSAFEAGFTMQEPVPTEIGLPMYTVMATGVVAYWAAATFNPLPPHPPCISPTTGITLLSPGAPAPLDVQMMAAFKSGMAAPDPAVAAQTVSSMLVAAFTAHLTLISGLYNGLMPSPTGPVPAPPVPWVGLV